ncbi:MAG: NAD(P)/FAD-dependent oxidoreductase [Myxococcota bacterium]
MSSERRIEKLTASDEELARHLEDAQLPALLLATSHLTGDPAILEGAPQPVQGLLAGPQGGFDEAQIADARARCFTALKGWRDAGCPEPPRPTEAELRRLLSFVIDEARLDETLPFLLDELSLDGADTRAPRWKKSELAPDRDFHVAIIGAGMSGLCAGIRLQQAGVPFTIFEKSDDVGGTWHDNVYPGCRVDVSNHFYSYSFAQGFEWPQLFSTQPVLLAYFQHVADAFGLREHIRFGTEVERATFDEATGSWTLALGGDAAHETATAHVLVSGMGQLNRPRMPEIEGMDDFQGPAFHSARWDRGVDLAGKRVAVIGTGASACQFIPIVADQASELTVLQRTPPWLLPTEDYHEKVPAGLQWLYQHVPHYAEWYRFWLFWSTAEGLLETVEVQDDWAGAPASVGPLNEEVRVMLLEYLKEATGGDDALLEKMTPGYPPFSKRFVRDNGILPRTFARDDVTLETTGIERITEKGLRLSDGREVEVDVIVYGTGFTASDFLMPLEVIGRDGRKLHDHWAGDARAYLGITLPHFPNLFLLYGPNTNIVVNGSIIFFTECEVDYLLASIEMLLRDGKQAMDCRPEVHDAYNARIDADNQRRAWGAATVNTWYKNQHGRVSQNWPYGLLDYWKQTRKVESADYELL